jgi:hypothetical protein
VSGVYTCTICDAVILDKYSLQVRDRIGRRKKENTNICSVVDPDQVQDPTFHSIISDLDHISQEIVWHKAFRAFSEEV